MWKPGFHAAINLMHLLFQKQEIGLLSAVASNLLSSSVLSLRGLVWFFDVCVSRRLLWGTFYYIQQRYLVDPASSHMLVSKIKPCMSKYKQLYTVKLRTAHYISYNLFDGDLLHG